MTHAERNAMHPGPLKWDDRERGWVQLGEHDSRAYAHLAVHSLRQPPPERMMVVLDHCVFVKNRDGSYDRWRGHHHDAYGEPVGSPAWEQQWGPVS